MIRRIKLDQYESTVTIEVVKDVTKRLSYLYKKFKLEEDGSEAYGACFAPTNYTYYLLYQENELSYNLITHELYHLVTRINEDRGIEGEEAAA